MVQIIVGCENRASMQQSPEWLETLTLLLHHRRATVITFNYDRLLEAQLERAAICCDPPGEYSRTVEATDALRNLPPVPPQMRPIGSQLAHTFRLLKLHGALDWWSAPLDETGSSLVRVPRINLAASAELISELDRGDMVPGREVFVVPPTLTKATYYRNFLTRELWRTSFQALQNTIHVAIVGYSMPIGDSMLAGMLVNALQGRNVPIEVVNREAREVGERVSSLGLDHVDPIPGDSSVADFVGQYLHRSENEFFATLSTYDPGFLKDLPVVVTTGMASNNSRFSQVTKINDDKGAQPPELLIQKKGLALGNAIGTHTGQGPSIESVIEVLRTNGPFTISDGSHRYHPINFNTGVAPGHSQWDCFIISVIEEKTPLS